MQKKTVAGRMGNEKKHCWDLDDSQTDAIIWKKKTSSQIFFAFLRPTLSFEHFPKKEDPHSWCISEITDSEKRA